MVAVVVVGDVVLVAVLVVVLVVGAVVVLAVVVFVAVGESRLVVADDRTEVVPLTVEDTAAVVP